MPESIFSDEWRDCLRAHYTYVARMSDHVTEKTLRGVMHEAGFTDAELKELYVLATAHVDHVGADFVPDRELLAEESAPATTVIAMPQAVIEAQIVEESIESQEVAAIQEEMPGEVEAEIDADSDQTDADESADDDPPKPDPNIKQLSLF